MNDGRMWVRDPFSDKALADRAAADEVSMANLGETSKEDGSSISSTTSYEDGASEDETVIIEGGGETTSPSSQTGKSKVVPLATSRETIVNSQYELSTTAALSKV